MLASGTGDVAIIAPFMTAAAMSDLLEAIPATTHVRCVTRWLPEEVAQGVSDLAVFDLLEARGNSKLTLVDRLHAKIYVCGSVCLAGSANVTMAGMGTTSDSNIEVLVESTVEDPGVAEALSEIGRREREATRVIAETVRSLAFTFAPDSSRIDDNGIWFPKSRRPQDAYQVYSQAPNVYQSNAASQLIADVALANLPAGLNQEDFINEMRALLSNIPLSKALLLSDDDAIVSQADAHVQLGPWCSPDYSISDLWMAFVQWMVYFFPDKFIAQEVSEVALRRAQML